MLIVPEVVPTIRGDYDLNEPRQETAGVFLTSTARISPDKEMTIKAKNFAPFSTPVTIGRLPASSFLIGWPTAWARHRLEAGASEISDIHRNLQAGLLKAILEGSEFAGELGKFAIAEFRKDKVV